MKQSEITTIRNTIATRIPAIVDSAIPASKANVDGNAEIMKALAHGQPVKMRTAAAIRSRALNLIVAERYQSSRHFSFEDIFESSGEVAKAREAAALVDRRREKLSVKLHGVKDRILAECKLGAFDTEHGAALDAFEEKAASVVASIT